MNINELMIEVTTTSYSLVKITHIKTNIASEGRTDVSTGSTDKLKERLIKVVENKVNEWKSKNYLCEENGWFGEGCEYLCGQWEDIEFKDCEPILKYCNHERNTDDHEGNCNSSRCPILIVK